MTDALLSHTSLSSDHACGQAGSPSLTISGRQRGSQSAENALHDRKDPAASQGLDPAPLGLQAFPLDCSVSLHRAGDSAPHSRQLGSLWAH